MQGVFKDLTGSKFKMLTVIKREGSYRKKNGCSAIWLCKCECGNETLITTDNLKNTTSCGCYHKPRASWNRLPENESIINSVFANYRNRAKKLNLIFSITKEEFKSLIFKNCHYCNCEPNQIINYSNLKRRKYGYILKYNGVDRKNSNLGYTIDNCVSCCKTCNYGKRDLSYSDWINHLDNLVKFREIK